MSVTVSQAEADKIRAVVAAWQPEKRRLLVALQASLGERSDAYQACRRALDDRAIIEGAHLWAYLERDNWADHPDMLQHLATQVLVA